MDHLMKAYISMIQVITQQRPENEGMKIDMVII